MVGGDRRPAHSTDIMTPLLCITAEVGIRDWSPCAPRTGEFASSGSNQIRSKKDRLMIGEN